MRRAESKSTLHIPIAAARIIKFENGPATRRYRGIPYMNEFRGVKQRDGARLYVAKPAARREVAIVPGGIRLRSGSIALRSGAHSLAVGPCGFRYAAAVGEPALHILLCIYCLRKSPLRCNISAMNAFPDMHDRLAKLLKEA
jgi:hypothetical protein